MDGITENIMSLVAAGTVLAKAGDAQHTDQWWTTVFVIGHFTLQLALALRVIMRRRSVGESLSWIMVIFVFPVAGLVAYLLVGELRLGHRRARRFESVFDPIREWLDELPQQFRVNWADVGNDFSPLAHLARRSFGLPALSHNEVELLTNWNTVFDRLIKDIDAAEHSCDLLFYIWQTGGRADEVSEALLRANARGVCCRILVDSVGSRSFLKGKICRQMQQAGIEICGALPGGGIRMLFVRFDLRMHRKAVIIDGAIAYTGSLNLVDPRFFKQKSGVGNWVDAMVRITGPAVEAFTITFLGIWFVESKSDLAQLREQSKLHPTSLSGQSILQVLPSGPAFRSDAIENFLLMAIYSAHEQVILTTPYFVPSEALRVALTTAVQRGVEVILIVPDKVDSLLVRFASQAFKADLLTAGVKILQFQGGLLHTKSITIDKKFSLFGSLNLDPRSFRLNFEISLAIFDPQATNAIHQLQQSYMDRSEIMDFDTWNSRSVGQRFAENVARLMEPLL
jgi:cardiolipin synthase